MGAELRSKKKPWGAGPRASDYLIEQVTLSGIRAAVFADVLPPIKSVANIRTNTNRFRMHANAHGVLLMRLKTPAALALTFW